MLLAVTSPAGGARGGHALKEVPLSDSGPSSRQARYLGPDGVDHPASMTFATKKDADLWLSRTEIEIIGDQWIDPVAGAISFGDYGAKWVRERPNLRPKTVQLYEYSLRRHLRPTFGSVPIRDIREPAIRRWRTDLLESGVSAIAIAEGLPADESHSEHRRG
jgi:Phage integrase, N-terminal SAM-like domain